MAGLVPTRVIENTAVVERAKALLSPKEFRQALFQTIKRTTREGRTDTRKELKAQVTKLAQKYIERVITSKLETFGEYSGVPPVGRIAVNQESLPLIAFGPRVSKRGGVTAQITKGGKPIRFGHGFKATMKSGHVGVYIRQRLGVFTPQTTAQDLVKAGFPEHEARQILAGASVSELYGRGIRYQKRVAFGGNFPRANAKGIAWRLPIKELRGPSVESIAELKDVGDRIEAALEQRFEKNLNSQIDRFTKQ